MAKYTVELSEMLAGYVGLVDPNANPRHLIMRGHHDDSNSYVDKDLDYSNHDFDINATLPNGVIEKYAPSFMRDHLASIPESYTDQDDLNKAITDQMFRTFVRHFYGWEIGQEDPNYWWVLVQDWISEFLPLYVQEYQKMMIENQNFITSRSWAHQHAGSSEVNGTADTPQNQLDFTINTGDPAKDYNFNFSSNVAGDKSHTDSSQYSAGRNETIMALINELESFQNGLYVNLFQHAKSYGLFMEVM